MAKIGYLYLRDGVWEDKQLIPPAWIDSIEHATVDMHRSLEPDLHYANLFWTLPDKHVYMYRRSSGRMTQGGARR